LEKKGRNKFIFRIMANKKNVVEEADETQINGSMAAEDTDAEESKDEDTDAEGSKDEDTDAEGEKDDAQRVNVEPRDFASEFAAKLIAEREEKLKIAALKKAARDDEAVPKDKRQKDPDALII